MLCLLICFYIIIIIIIIIINEVNESRDCASFTRVIAHRSPSHDAEETREKAIDMTEPTNDGLLPNPCDLNGGLPMEPFPLASIF